MDESACRPALVGHFVWEPPARDIAILLNLELVDRLQQLIREAPDREIGGVLLGRYEHSPGVSDRYKVTVGEFEPIPSEHLRGPAFILSQHDQKVLDKSLSRPQGHGRSVAVGFFRSHLRKGLYLDKADFSLFQDYFSGPSYVFLVARPEPGVVPAAGFFYWQGELLHRQTTYSQFPLDRKKLESGGHLILGARSTPASQPAPAVAAPVIARPVPQQPRVRIVANRRVLKKFGYGAAGALLILTAVLAAVLLHSGGGTEALNVPVVSPAKPPRTQPKQTTQIAANRPAPAPPPVLAQPPASAKAPASAKPEVRPPATQHPAAEPPRPAPQLAQKKSAFGPVAEQRATVHPRPRLEPAVSITTQAVPPPKYRGWIGRVPLIRSIQRNRNREGESFVPPRPAHEVTPRIPPRLARELPGESQVDFRLSIDSAGHVRQIALMSPRAEPQLADIAADALASWRFEPATLRGKPVSSEVVATLHFRNPVPESTLAQRQ